MQHQGEAPTKEQPFDFKSLQLDEKAFAEYRKESAKRTFTSPNAGSDPIEEKHKRVIKIKMVGSAAKAFGNVLEVAVSALDDTSLFAMRRIENQIRIPLLHWVLLFHVSVGIFN